MIRLRGGPCELRQVHVSRRVPADYYGARLEFAKGQSVSVPLYVPFAEADAVLERRAMEVARAIGERATQTGEIDLAEWVLEKRIPLRDYLRDRLRTIKETTQLPNGLQFSAQLRGTVSADSPLAETIGGFLALDVSIYNGNDHTRRARFSVSVPAAFRSPELRAILDRDIDAVLGEDNRRHRLKSTAHERQTSESDIRITRPPRAHLRLPPMSNATALFTLSEDGGQFNCSLGVTDPVIAAQRMAQVNEFIRRTIGDEGGISIADVRSYCRELVESGQSHPAPTRINPTRDGPVIIYGPRSNAKVHEKVEALRCYTALAARPGGGHTLTVHFVPPGGRGINRMYSAVCGIAVERGIDLGHAEELRAQVRDFLEQHLTRFYRAGGVFRDDEDIAAGGKSGLALTTRGVEKMQRVLEGRLSSAFVNAALSAGISNPFDSGLSPETVHRLGGAIPQPAHWSLRLVNARAVSPHERSSSFRATLVWKGADDRSILSEDLTFANASQLAEMVDGIDQWTAGAVAEHGGELPEHSGVEVLRRLTQPYRDQRQRE